MSRLSIYKAERQISDELPAVRTTRFLGGTTSALGRNYALLPMPVNGRWKLFTKGTSPKALVKHPGVFAGSFTRRPINPVGSVGH